MGLTFSRDGKTAETGTMNLTNLLPENIRQGVNIAGVVGKLGGRIESGTLQYIRNDATDTMMWVSKPNQDKYLVSVTERYDSSTSLNNHYIHIFELRGLSFKPSAIFIEQWMLNWNKFVPILILSRHFYGGVIDGIFYSGEYQLYPNNVFFYNSGFKVPLKVLVAYNSFSVTSTFYRWTAVE